ncbi:MAG: helix-turn-helix domain-containing protein [Candidatus Binataceae bacterium]|jgi:excisionase family DNA binding protein
MATQRKDSEQGEAPVMNVAELCASFKIHRSTIYRLIKRGMIPHFRIGSDYRFNREAIDQWWRSLQQAERDEALREIKEPPVAVVPSKPAKPQAPKGSKEPPIASAPHKEAKLAAAAKTTAAAKRVKPSPPAKRRKP